MVDPIILRCSYVWLHNKLLVSAYSGTQAGLFTIGSEASVALQNILNTGFTLISTQGDANGITYTFISAGGGTGIVGTLQNRVGSIATIETPAGAVTGTVLLVGADVVELREPIGSMILVPIASIQSVT